LGRTEKSLKIVILILEFPVNCITYFAPHSYECIESVWLEHGCRFDGRNHRNRFKDLMFPQLIKRNL